MVDTAFYANVEYIINAEKYVHEANRSNSFNLGPLWHFCLPFDVGLTTHCLQWVPYVVFAY